MRLLSRMLAGSPVRGGASSAPERCPERIAPALDDDLRDLLRRFVNSPVKLDLLLYLHANPYAIDGTETLALRLGREAQLIEACAAELARDGLLVASQRRATGDAPVYRLTSDSSLARRVERLAALHAAGGASGVRSAIRDVGTAEAIYAAIAGSARVSAHAITVRCEEGTAVVEGRVNTAAERAELEVICERLGETRHGIRAVENRVGVEARRLPTDASTREAVGRITQERTPQGAGESVERLRIGLDVIGGVVYLTGLAASSQDRAWATQRAQEVPGVVGVVNWIDVHGQRGR